MLYAVAVVHVPVDDQHSFNATAFPPRIRHCHGHVVVDAETIGRIALSVVTGRAHNGEAVLVAIGGNRLDHAQCAASGDTCGGLAVFVEVERRVPVHAVDDTGDGQRLMHW